MPLEIKDGLCLRRIPLDHPPLTEAIANEVLELRPEAARRDPRMWMLAFADDGIIWGRVSDGTLRTSPDHGDWRCPRLRPRTLWRLHLFGESGELRMQRAGNEFRAEWLAEDADPEASYLDELRLLIGQEVPTPGEALPGPPEPDFVLARGMAGEIHTPPLSLPEMRRRSALRVRHFLHADPDTGMLRVHDTRIVGFC